MMALFETNTAAWNARMTALVLNLRPGIAAAMKELGDEIMQDSQENYCPVEDSPKNGIVLKETGRVDGPEITPAGVEVKLSYGREAHEYAIAVHEHLSMYSPPSWQVGGVTFRVGGPKYLELPVMSHSQELPVAVALSLRTFEGVVNKL
jgi:hypothetical protein